MTIAFYSAVFVFVALAAAVVVVVVVVVVEISTEVIPASLAAAFRLRGFHYLT